MEVLQDAIATVVGLPLSRVFLGSHHKHTTNADPCGRWLEIRRGGEEILAPDQWYVFRPLDHPDLRRQASEKLSANELGAFGIWSERQQPTDKWPLALSGRGIFFGGRKGARGAILHFACRSPTAAITDDDAPVYDSPNFLGGAAAGEGEARELAEVGSTPARLVLVRGTGEGPHALLHWGRHRTWRRGPQ